MKNFDLLTVDEFPPGFVYPRQFTRVVGLGLTDLEPWYLIQGKPLRDAFNGLKTRYPQRKRIPFAKRQDNDDIACWQIGSLEEVFVVHDFATEGWEQRAKFASFYDWLRHAIDDLIQFD